MIYLKHFFAAVLLLASAVLHAQPIGRTVGARRLVLDNNDLIPSHNVYLIDNAGTLGIDNQGLFLGGFPSPCAMLDLSSTTKGFLPPRMSTIQELLICGGSPIEGLMLYNLTNHAAEFYNGAAYAQLWSAKGNFGTNPVIDSLGTTDSRDIVIRTTNFERARILSGGNVAIGSPIATSHVQISESGTQDAFNSVHSGTAGRSANFQETNVGNSSDAVNISQGGLGKGLNIVLSNVGNPSDGVNIMQSGLGKSLNVISNNAANASDEVDIMQGGLGKSLNVVSSNSGNAVRAVDIVQSGTGTALAATINNGASTATLLNLFSNGTGTGISITTAASNNQLVVNGTNNASVASTAGNAVWDSRINGDQLVTGIQKVGGSIWLDGNSATHQIVTDAPINLGTKNANTTSLVTNNIPRLFIDGTGNTTITGNLSLTGIAAPALPAPFIHILYLNPTNQINQTPAGVDIVTGSGVLNTIPMWTPDGFKIGNSIITQTSNMGINITPGVPTTTNNVLVVNGTADATVANTAASSVWDERVNGDLLVAGIAEFGGSISIDGKNAFTPQILSNTSLDIGTKIPGTIALITKDIQRLYIDGLGNTTITGGSTTINEGDIGKFTVTSTSTGLNYAAKIKTSGQNGLEVHCGGTTLDNNTHFVDFFANDGRGARGSIQGQDFTDLTTDPTYQLNQGLFAANTALSAALIVLGVAAIPAGASPPFPVALAAVTAAIAVAQVVQLAFAIAQYQIQKDAIIGALGVAYTSSAGDYAEYLMRTNPDDKFYPGDIVGVKNGMISKNTDGAESIYSISLAPIVLGNVPPVGKEKLYNKVGFLGQVPVKVSGAVHEGDFILASGLNDGIGIAVAPKDLKPEELPRLVGRAWSSSNFEWVKYITVAVGLNTKTMGDIMATEQSEIDVLRAQLDKSASETAVLRSRLDRLESKIEVVNVHSN